MKRSVLAAAAVVCLGAALITSGADAAPRRTVLVQLVSITDLHGYFGDYTTTVPGSQAGEPAQTVGGGAYLATHIKQLRAGNPNSMLFSAGDDFSGWPDETEFFWNEPTIEYLNAVGLDFSTMGNHEFDRGPAFLHHMMDGTCQGRPDDDICFVDSTGERFGGADYDYYAGNIINKSTGKPELAPYHVEYVDDGAGGRLPIGFVHATEENLSNEGMSYTPSGFAFRDEADTVNKYAKVLQRKGVRAIVAVIHEGFSQAAGSGYNDCRDPFGPAVDEFNKQITPAVDAIVTGHWHALVNCMLPDPAGNPRPVVVAANHGRLINEINLQLDASTGEVTRDLTTSVQHPNTQDVMPDPEALRIADYWRGRVPERVNAPIGTITGDLARAPGDVGESTLGNVSADAFAWATDVDLAVGMPGLLRNDLPYAANPSYSGDADGRVVWGELLFNAIPNEHGVVLATVSGRTIDALLEGQWQESAYQNLPVSNSVRYRYDESKPLGDRVSGVTIGGSRLTADASYRIAAPGALFLERYAPVGLTALIGSPEQRRTLYNTGDALWHYLTAKSPVAPPAVDRGQPVS